MLALICAQEDAFGNCRRNERRRAPSARRQYGVGQRSASVAHSNHNLGTTPVQFGADRSCGRSSTKPPTKKAGIVIISASPHTTMSFTPIERDLIPPCKLNCSIETSLT